MADERQFGGGRGWSARRWGVVAFVGFFLMIGAWSLAAPYNSTPDEQAHIVRAVGVVSGQITPRTGGNGSPLGAYQVVPSGLVRDPCYQSKSELSAACAKPPSADRTPVSVVTGAGWYNPLYYALVGWPLRFWPGWPGVLIARLISAAASALLLAAAMVSVMRWSRLRLMVLGMVAVTTPMTLQMTSAVNPNGLEIAAGIALFASGIPLFLLHRREKRFNRPLLWQTVISAGILATLRAAGPLWLVFAAAALLLPVRWAAVRGMLRDRVVRWSVAVLGVVVLLAVGWTLTQKATGATSFRDSTVFSPEGSAYAILQQWHQYTDELVGIMSYLDTRLPEIVYMVWEGAVVSLLVAALVQGTRVDRWRLLVIFFGGAVVPSFIQVSLLNQEGFITQGRYMLPLLVGLVLLAAFILEERGLSARAVRVSGRLFATLVLPLQLGALAFTMVRWQHGLVKKYASPGHDLNPLAGPWHPVVGSLMPLLVELAGTCVMGYLLWTSVGRPGIARTEAPEASAAQAPVSEEAADPATTDTGAGVAAPNGRSVPVAG